MRFLILGATLASLIGTSPAFARDSLLDISVNGMQEKNNYVNSKETKSTLGVELGIPITQYFQISFGYTFREEETVYNEEYSLYYRGAAAQKKCGALGTNTDAQNCGASIMNGKPYKSLETYSDITANASFGYPIGLFYPSIFFGKLWRKTNLSNSVEDIPVDPNNTWNAGAAAQMYLTHKLRFKLAYRISPSVNFSSKKREFDTLTTLGLTYSL